MREQHSFGERSTVSKSLEPIKKYFLLYEGECTEKIYFDEIKKQRDNIGVKPYIELIPILRNYSEQSWSNPEKILQRLMDNLDESKSHCISYFTLLDSIISCIEKTSKLSAKEINLMWVNLRKACEDSLGISELNLDVQDINKDACTLLEKFGKSLNIKNILNLLPQVIESFCITYDKNYDKICCIFDRDKKSFNSRQYDTVLKICQTNGFYLCISNPCFEFWLLMHFEEVMGIDREKLLENKKANGKNYAHKQLRTVAKKYDLAFDKSDYDAVFFIKRLDIALANTKFFSEDNQNLKNTLGSSVGVLIRELKMA